MKNARSRKLKACRLLTADVTHFGLYFGRAAAGVRILTPAQYLGGGKR